jgi:SAM-dependent methyltransferase
LRERPRRRLARGKRLSHGRLRSLRRIASAGARLHPGVTFEVATLPELHGIADASFDNVLCETVIMHLGRDAIAPAVRRGLAIVKPDGVLALSWRVETADRRDDHGRLYSVFDRDLVLRECSDTAILLDQEIISPSSGRKIHRLVARRGA